MLKDNGKTIMNKLGVQDDVNPLTRRVLSNQNAPTST